MKRICSLIVMLSMLVSGCRSSGIDPGLELRDQLTHSSGISFLAEITADYGEYIHTFSLVCEADAAGNLSFKITAPDTIANIEGNFTGSGGNLSFDEKILAFPLLADGQISPISAPWLLMQLLLGGYISYGGVDGDHYLIHIDDSFDGHNIGADIWLDSRNVPIHSDLIWDGKRFLTMKISDFMCT